MKLRDYNGRVYTLNTGDALYDVREGVKYVFTGSLSAGGCFRFERWIDADVDTDEFDERTFEPFTVLDDDDYMLTCAETLNLLRVQGR